jgi:ABC-type nitrate/sulfonate/bicarbonate transport system substrate-binding protein
MMRTRLLLLYSFLLVFPLSVIGATPRPLSEVVKTQVADCAAPATTRVPFITWGGDIPTIHANGGAAVTASGSQLGQQNLKMELFREDNFTRQLDLYLRCESPYLRGTLGMLALASEVTEQDPRTKMAIVYQLTWSAGGDAMVVKEGIRTPRDLKGRTIALQAYGPHVDYMARVLADAALKLSDVNLVWEDDLSGTDNSPAAAFYRQNVDAAMVILPDALALTAGGNVGTGAENSVKGARILLSTRTANRVITDLYAVRSDFLNAHRDQVERFVYGLLQAQETVAATVGKNPAGPDARPIMQAAASLLLDSPEAHADAAAMYGDAEFAGWTGNVQFFTDNNYPRRFDVLLQESQQALIALGLLKNPLPVGPAKWDYDNLKKGLFAVASVKPASRFDTGAVTQVINRRAQQGTLGEGELFSFAVQFRPNQNDFKTTEYADSFKRAVDLASVYGGAVVTVEGHSDPLGYINQKQSNQNPVVLTRIRQAAKNLSLSRANAVRDSVIAYAREKGVSLDTAQFAVVGHGFDHPLTGMCGADPCKPKSEQEWLSNMRVEFRIIQVEAEAEVFAP